MILQKAIWVHKGPSTQSLLRVQGFTMYLATFITKEMTLCIILSIGHLYPVDFLAGNPEVLQEASEAYYEKLLQQTSSTPEFFSIPGGEKVKLEDSSVCFLPVYREDPKYKILVLRDPQDNKTVLAIYLNQSWWPIEDIVKTADSSREGLIQVQTFGERIVLFVLNCIIFGMLERSSANDTFFVSHSAKECAKIFWRNGDAVAFYTVKMKENRVPQTASEEEGGCHEERPQGAELRHLDAGQMDEGGECIPNIRKVAQEAKDNKDNTAGEAGTLHLQIPREEDFSQDAADMQQCKGSRKRASTVGLLEEKGAKHLRMLP
ncbi:protein FAM169B-like isoform X6 [Emydura macquarii macquarii]|uniref:protein FAM169B-like isoform X6 n=1 Tax=Emydura macquarii macquarii TaxID=1129001 RepID=UPI003529F95F